MTFTQNAVAEALHNAVQTKGGDYVYESRGSTRSCFYVDPDGSPSCIVGWVVDALQPEILGQLAEYETATGASFGVQYLTGSSRDGVPAWHREKAEKVGTFEVPEHVAIALQAAQSVQDEGHTWAEAEAAFNIVLADEFPEDCAYHERAEYAQIVATGGEWQS